MEAATVSALDRRNSASRLPDDLLRWVLTALAAGIFVLLAYFFVRLFVEARPAFQQEGVFGFVFHNDWDVSKNIYGALPLVTGKLITSAIALVFGVPVAVATALFVTELCPSRAKGPL